MKDQNDFLYGNITKVVLMHYIRLFYRSVLFITMLTAYVYDRLHGINAFSDLTEIVPVIARVFMVVFLAEMFFRHFPSKLDSPGCQKQFAVNYRKTDLFREFDTI